MGRTRKLFYVALGIPAGSLEPEIRDSRNVFLAEKSKGIESDDVVQGPTPAYMV